MGDLKKTTQKPGGATTGMTPKGTEGENNHGAEFGASEAATRGTDRDLDRSGTSANQGHGHPREERGQSHD
jgi:hypothetical protein